LDWQSKAATALFNPFDAYTNASDIGENLALNLKGKNYSHIHFIAHSAGANLIDFATIWLRSMGKERESAHGSNTRDIPGRLRSRLGCHPIWQASDWTLTTMLTRATLAPYLVLPVSMEPNYFSRTPITSTLRRTQRVTIILMNVANNRPYRFYGLSVDTSFSGALLAACDPINGTGGMGYPLSSENGNS